MAGRGVGKHAANATSLTLYPPSRADSRGSASEKTREGARSYRKQEARGEEIEQEARNKKGARSKRQEIKASKTRKHEGIGKKMMGCNLELVSSRFKKGRQAEAAAGRRPGPSLSGVAWCFGVAKPTFWRLEGCNLELTSCRFRKKGSRRPKAWSVPEWHGVLVWRSQRFGGLKVSCQFRKRR